MKKQIVVVLITLLLISCRGNEVASDNEIATKTLSPMTEIPAPEITVPTNKVADASTPTTTFTPEIMFTKTTTQECSPINEKAVSLQDLAKTGTVAIYDNKTMESYLLDLESGIQYPLRFQDQLVLPQITVSPSGKYIAYLEDTEDNAGQIVKQRVYVGDNKGNVLAESQINPEVLFADWHWLDDESIQFSFHSLTPKDGTVAIFYPINNEWKYFSNELPNFYKYFDLDPTQWLIEYSPDLKQTVYLGQIEEFKVGPIVWDASLKEIIWQSPDTNAGIKVPKWSPSGDEVVVIKDGYMYLISNDGKVSVSPQLTRDTEIMNISWSPNGAQIAVSVRYDPSSRNNALLLYDVHRNQFIDTCLEGDMIRPPLWSANSQFLYLRLKSNDSGEMPVVIDTTRNKANKIVDDLELLAWMNSR